MTTPFFLTVFLPVFVGLYYLAARSCRLWALLAFSLFFYAWNDVRGILLLFLLALVNYCLGLLVGALRRPRFLIPLILGVVLDISALIAYKYLNFFAATFPFLPQWLGIQVSQLNKIVIPLGISFYIFQLVSYLVDVSRGDVVPERSFARFLLFVSFFPKIFCGPIVRYGEMAKGFISVGFDHEGFCSGLERFAFGLGKKILVADTLAVMADAIFASPVETLPCCYCWLGAISYTFQIYFDFSGYSDMAIGLARVFNFRLPENFDYPYVSCSIQEFWRRWHISLSTWFRDYLYIPLGGNRNGRWHMYLNMCIVFLLCGIWHGGSWTFVLWGGYHGFGLVLEKAGFSRLLKRVPPVVANLYVMIFVLVGWVIFRAPDIGYACNYLNTMFTGSDNAPYWSYVRAYSFLDFIGPMMILLAIPLSRPGLYQRFLRWPQFHQCLVVAVVSFLGWLFAITAVSAPGIYGQF